MKKAYFSIIAAALVTFTAMAAVYAAFSISSYQQSNLLELEAKKTADRFADAQDVLSATALDATLDAVAKECCSGSGKLGEEILSNLNSGYFAQSTSNSILGQDGFTVSMVGTATTTITDCERGTKSISYSFSVKSPTGKVKKDGTESIEVTITDLGGLFSVSLPNRLPVTISCT